MDYRRHESSEDSPVYSRLFIVCDRNSTEQDFREAFSQFGTVENIRIPHDPNTGNAKGIVFIKFSKTSEAAAALEAMNFQTLPNSNRRLKIMIATNRSDIRDSQDEDNTEKYLRLFVTIPRKMRENELEEYFNQFGKVDSVLIQRDRETHESKGFAYITYRTFKEAALAFEGCDRSYRCVFSQPKRHRRNPETVFQSSISNLASSSLNHNTALVSMMTARPEGYTRVNFVCSPYLTQLHVERLFDIIPGMIHCRYFVDLMRNHGKGMVQYSNPVSAAHAVAKINDFECPPGSRIHVNPGNNKFDTHEKNFDNLPNVVKNLKGAIESSSNTSTPDLAQLAEAIAEASKLIKMATTGVNDNDLPDTADVKYCSVPLPQPQPLADIDSPTAKRCFLVCKPQPPPLTVLRDIFCRFGNLITVYTLPNKTVGYARYARSESADEAIKVLHGAEICGVRIKVLEADDEVPPKRSRMTD
ncbi:RNA-binding protein 45-like [Epargyreus clarus]|uniref:RNA-binding protein 45-like n=1 Tax=Epargyreus clarus TaxID=520877 RepID=UPI003C2F58F6